MVTKLNSTNDVNTAEQTSSFLQLETPNLEISSSRLSTTWLAKNQHCLTFATTYQAGELFLVGCKPDGSLSGFERTFERMIGIFSDGQTMWLSSAYQIWRLENSLARNQNIDGFDRLYVPQLGYDTKRF